MSMMGAIQILPLPIAWAVCYLLARELVARQKINPDWRLSFAFASVAWGTILTFLVELLSLGRLLTASLVCVSWIVVTLALFCFLVQLIRQRGSTLRAEFSAFQQQLRSVPFRELAWDTRLYFGVTAALACFLFVIALGFATTNWDSLTYHLSRIMHWMQHQSVAHYPTGNQRQIEFGPWSSFVGLNLYLLWGSDRLLNLIQWVAMVGSITLTSFLCKSLVGPSSPLPPAERLRMTAFTCVIAVTIPMGLVQCVNPQTDYTPVFWLCCLVCFALALFGEPDNPWYMVGAGAACGLGTLTKATVYIYAAPLVVGFGTWWLLRSNFGRAKARLAFCFCAAFMAINAGHMVRNYAVFGSPLGSKYIVSIEKNEQITVSGTAANVVRNLSLHSNTGVNTITKKLNRLINAIDKLTGRSQEDPQINYHIPGYFRFHDRFHVFDSYASSPYHLILVLVALIVALSAPARYKTALWHLAWVGASFLLLCAYLKWQYGHTRLHLAYFLLLSPVIGWILIDRFHRSALILISAGLTIFSAFSLWHNQSRPLLNPRFTSLSREDQYASVHGFQFVSPIRQVAEAAIASGARHIGVKFAFDDPEYVFWVMLRNRGFKGTIRHLFVENESAKIPSLLPPPDLIIASEGAPRSDIMKLYPVQGRYGPFLVIAKAGSNLNGSNSMVQAVSPQPQ